MMTPLVTFTLSASSVNSVTSLSDSEPSSGTLSTVVLNVLQSRKHICKDPQIFIAEKFTNTLLQDNEERVSL
jgi:hypothetical protein